MTQGQLMGMGALRGIVVAAAWDASGVPTRVALLTQDEGEYLVQDAAEGPQLIGLLREEVEAHVVLHRAVDGSWAVTVLSYEVLDESLRDRSSSDQP